MTDSLLGDRYALGPLLGRGGMAEVRQARDTLLERDVAIKLLKVDLAGDPIFQQRFRREAKAAANLNDPNIVSVFDTGESRDEASGLMIPYIVMELVVGHTLREILHDGRKLQPVKVLEITQSILKALDYSHRHGIVHRDIKPANVMVTNTGQVKVMDFGIARAVSDTAASMTQTASVIGTPQYLSPEQIRGETVDRRSDLYSTGCLLYELLTGKPPFEGDSPVSLAYQHVRATPVPPSQIDPLVSTQMDAVVLKALAKDPADRYQSAHEMSEDISRLLAGQRVQAVIPPPVDEGATEVMPMSEKTQVMPARAAAAGKLPARAAEPVDEEEPGRLGRVIGIVVGIMLVIALVAAGLILFLNKDNNAPPVSATTGQVAVPNVFSMSQDAADKTLRDKGLVSKVEEVQGPDDKTVGTVTNQSPLKDTLVPVGSTVTVTINVGPGKVTIPSTLKAMSAADAKKVLTDLGFTNVTTKDAPDDEAAGAQAGTVVSTDPAMGAKVSTSTAITLYIATGNVPMPAVPTNDLAAAKAQLAAAGFNNVAEANVTVDAANQVGSYTIDPAPGSPISKDTKITITVANLMPNLIGEDADAVLTRWGSWGFTSIPSKVPVESTQPANTVTYQTPKAGEILTQGAETPLDFGYAVATPATTPSGKPSSSTTGH
ncbi:MAG: Stk1 family PASTA domain-containing Ser/Thr kinase [Propionibacteriaceae bacterium]|nr:Stk1 family PASTA domain-containing Ser/Thr kinase [Propionibacteriaceae bacterium]